MLLKRNKFVSVSCLGVSGTMMLSLTQLTFLTAQQEAQRASFIVDRAKQEKQSIIVRAEGEAKSAELIGDAIKNKVLLALYFFF